MNPTVKKGDLVIVKDTRNEAPNWENVILEVTTVKSGSSPSAKDTTGKNRGNIGLYSNYVFILADRKAQADFVKSEIKELKAKIGTLEQDLEILSKFDSDEEYTAHKIDRLLKAKGVKAKTEILRELKRTNFI